MLTDEQRAERLLRLRWACRRTLKELDAPLSQFLNQHYPNLPMGGQFAFERLLSAADQDILDWIRGRRMPRDAGVQAILALMQTPPAQPSKNTSPEET